MVIPLLNRELSKLCEQLLVGIVWISRAQRAGGLIGMVQQRGNLQIHYNWVLHRWKNSSTFAAIFNGRFAMGRRKRLLDATLKDAHM